MKTTLTKTEDRIVRLKMLGYQRKEIADQLCRSLDTVAVHFRNIYEKTEVQNEIELYNWYCENVFNINIRRLLQVTCLLIILLPSIVSQDDIFQRVQRARTSQRVLRSRRGETDPDPDNYLFN